MFLQRSHKPLYLLQKMPTGMPTRTPTKEEKAEIQTYPVTAKKKRIFCFMFYCFTSAID